MLFDLLLLDHTICIKFYVKNRVESTNAFKKVDCGIRETTLYQEYYKRFIEGRADVNDDERPGAENIETQKK